MGPEAPAESSTPLREFPPLDGWDPSPERAFQGFLKYPSAHFRYCAQS